MLPWRQRHQDKAGVNSCSMYGISILHAYDTNAADTRLAVGVIHSLGIEVNDSVIQELFIIQATEVMLCHLYYIQLSVKWVDTPQILQSATRFLRTYSCVKSTMQYSCVLQTCHRQP